MDTHSKVGRILVETPTKDRDVILGRHIASLILQSFQDFDVLILNDGDEPVGGTNLVEFLLPFLKHGRSVWIEEGTHISQAHNHNIPLYDPRFADYKYYVRADDDVLLNRDCLEELVRVITETRAAAVGGLWMETEVLDNIHDRKIFWTQEEFDADKSINGDVDILNSNWQHRVYHPTDNPLKVEHVYSMAIVDMDKMRRAGGWPEVYSHGVAHGEETDGSYRLTLSGEDLYINPRATGQHLRSPGGIRSKSNLSQIQQMDLMKWQNRLPELRDINWIPTIAVECRHSYGVGGAERLFYHTVQLLQSKFGRGRVYPIFPCPHMTPEEVEGFFGFRYELVQSQDQEFDVLIVIGHEPQHITPAKHKIFYCLFPIEGVDPALLSDFDQVIGISDYTSDWIENWWACESRRIYPPVVPVCDLGDEKENIILIVSRCVPYKSPLWLMQRFIEMDLDGWTMHVVASTSIEAFDDYENLVLGYIEEHDNIVVHRNASNDQLQALYRRAKILWGASGLRGDNPQAAEHFGYTPVEAWSAGCIPIMYDRGGHKETVSRAFLWTNGNSLKQITNEVIETGSNGFYIPVDLSKFDPEWYATQWEWMILRVNAHALQLDRIVHFHVEDRPIRVALVADSPYMEEFKMGVTSGFGMVSGMIARRFIQEPDINLSVFGMYDPRMPKREDNLPFDFFPPIGDLGGNRLVPPFINWADPDVIFMLHAPGELHNWVSSLRRLEIGLPIVAYFPIEGAGRPNPAVVPLMDKIQFGVTYCQAGEDLIRQVVPDKEICHVYHGLDHADFAPLAIEDRTHIRELVGWDGKFIVIAVGTNKRVKQHPVLIEAIKILLSRGYDDIYLYLHTKEFDEYVLQGHDLRNMLKLDQHISGLPMEQHVLMPVIEDKWHSVSYDAHSIDTWRYVRPPTSMQRGVFFNSLDFKTRYGIADLYVDVSSCEGFGFGPLEAISCGVPAISVHDKMVRDEVHSKYCLDMIEPTYWDTWHTGTRLAMVSPEDVADAILKAYLNMPTREECIETSSCVKKDLRWEPAQDLFVDLVRRARALSGQTSTR